MLGDLGGAAGRHERRDRGDLAVPEREARPCVDVAVRELHDRPTEVAQTFDRGQRLLVVHLEESRPPPLVPVLAHGTPLFRITDLAQGRARCYAWTRRPSRPRMM